MGTHMKTTIEISDELLSRAKRLARQQKKTLREVIEEALRRQIASAPVEKFQLKRDPFKGKGLQSPIVEGRWEAIRDLIYRLG